MADWVLTGDSCLATGADRRDWLETHFHSHAGRSGQDALLPDEAWGSQLATSLLSRPPSGANPASPMQCLPTQPDSARARQGLEWLR
jgi:hypothetical protein